MAKLEFQQGHTKLDSKTGRRFGEKLPQAQYILDITDSWWEIDLDEGTSGFGRTRL